MNKLFNYLITVLFIFKLINALDPPTLEYNCLTTIINQFSVNQFSMNQSAMYDFCSYTSKITCDQTGSFLKLDLSSQGGNPTNRITPSYFQCFPKLLDLTLNYFDYSIDFIYYKFPTVNYIKYYYCTGLNVLNGINQALPNYDVFQFNSFEINNTNLKLSYICNIQELIITDGWVTLEEDKISILSNCLDRNRLTSLTLRLINFADMSFFTNLQQTTFNFNDNFQSTTISKFSTLKSTTVKVTHSITKVTTEFYAQLNSYISFLTITGSFSKPVSVIDLKPNINYKSIIILNPGYEFSLGTSSFEMPVSVNNNIEFTWDNGNLTSLPDLSKFGDKTHTTKITTSLIMGGLGLYNGTGKSYDFSSNKLSGSIDNSWCNTEISVYFNFGLTGLIPSCYSCYFQSNFLTGGLDKPMFNRFQGGSFTNNIKTTICTTFKPIVEVLTETTIKVSGTDIGFTSDHWLINNTIALTNTIPISIGKEYQTSLSVSSFVGVNYFIFTTLVPGRSFIFPVKRYNTPMITSVICAGGKITIYGSYFSSYLDYIPQVVAVDGLLLQVLSVDFATTQVDSSLVTQKPSLLSVVTDGSYRKRVWVDLTENFISQIQCPNDCTSDLNGYCNLITGQCTCETFFTGVDCSQKVCRPSPNCNGNGTCDNSSGTCHCNNNYQGEDCLTPFIQCPSNSNNEICSKFGECNNVTGSCLCDINHQGNDCSVPFKKCPIGLHDGTECSSLGKCDNVTGNCNCDSGRAGSDCSGYQCAIPNCSNNGYCNVEIGECVCQDKKWLGENCTIPWHIISSVTPTTINGGIVSIFGKFSNYHFNPTITIGDIDCPVIFISPVVYQCEATPGSGLKELILTQNGVSVKTNYQYIEINQKCSLDCSGHGTCDQINGGQCTCFNGYSSYDCSISSNDNGSIKPPTNTSINPNTGGTDLSNQEVKFSIYFKSLSEIDINGNPIITYQLQNNWNSTTNQQNQHTFKQLIQSDNSCSIISTIEEIKELNGKQFEFANSTFKLDQGSIKFSILISNYTFSNNLNTLSLDFISMVDDNSNGDDYNNECNSKDTEINSNSLQTFNYIKISKNNKILSGRFINKLMSDGKPTYLGTKITKESKSIIVSLQIPHCTEECLIDPDFSVLLLGDYKSKCSDNEESSRKWLIPVVVIIPVVAVASMITLSIYLIKKKSEKQLLLKLLKIKKNNNN